MTLFLSFRQLRLHGPQLGTVIEEYSVTFVILSTEGRPLRATGASYGAFAATSGDTLAGSGITGRLYCRFWAVRHCRIGEARFEAYRRHIGKIQWPGLHACSEFQP